MSLTIDAYRLVLVVQRGEPEVARMVRLERAYRHQRLKVVREGRGVERWGGLVGWYSIL